LTLVMPLRMNRVVASHPFISAGRPITRPSGPCSRASAVVPVTDKDPAAWSGWRRWFWRVCAVAAPGVDILPPGMRHHMLVERAGEEAGPHAMR
jgi:hypothetical protein